MKKIIFTASIFLLLFGFLSINSVDAAYISDGTVSSSQKIADNTGGFGDLVDSDQFGSSVVSIGDLDGDGVTDLAVGAFTDDTGGTNRGAVYILFMNIDGTVSSSQKIASGTGGFGVLVDSDFFGVSVTSIGDLDGDGITDLAVGATGDDTGGSGRGALYILFMNIDGTVSSSQKIASGTGGFGALVNSDAFGRVSLIGDLDGDSVDDLAIGVVGDDTGGSARGAVYILFMNTDGTVSSTQKIADNTGGFGTLVDFDGLGRVSVTSIGDLDGDGITDLAVGATGDDTGGSGRGALYILFMNIDGTVSSSQKIASGTGGFGALADLDIFGTSSSSVGDLNGDGVIDLVVGASLDNTGGTDRGAAYILFMNTDGTVSSSQKIADNTGGFGDLVDSDQFGSSVVSIGDLDGDGVIDLAVTAAGDDTGGADRGALYILFLNSNPTVTTTPVDTITRTTATLHGEITDTGGEDATERGFNWGTTTSYGTDVIQNSGPYTTGTFNTTLSNLGCSTTYHYRAYATNVVDTTYGDDVTFTTETCTISSGSRSGYRSIVIVPPVVTTVATTCLLGEKFSPTTGSLCTSFISLPAIPLVPVCTITSTLRRGDQGPEVLCLQTKLNILSDGLFGPMTKAAVILFQKNKNLVPDGVVGPKTRAEMGN